MIKLADLKIALSVSDASDRGRLGFPSREIDRALLTICTVLVRQGADIIYAGNLDPNQHTFKIFRHLAGAYAGSRDQAPFVHTIPEPIARRTTFADLHAALRENGRITRSEICVGTHLVPVRASGDTIQIGSKPTRQRISSANEWTEWLESHPHTEAGEAYTHARRAVSNIADARIVLGGKMGVLDREGDTYEGVAPGVAEEATMTLSLGRPLVVLGAFGGAARDIAISLGLLDPDRRVPRGEQQPSYAPAMHEVSTLSDRIPSSVRESLAEIADDDRGEPTAYLISNAIVNWRAAVPN